jgi:hypothetical protein
VHLILIAHLRLHNNFKVFSKFVLALVQLSFAFRIGSLDVGDALASTMHKVHNAVSPEMDYG